MTQLVWRLKAFPLENILGEVERSLTTNGDAPAANARSTDLAAVLGLWSDHDDDNDEEETGDTDFLNRDPGELIEPMIDKGYRLLNEGSEPQIAERLFLSALHLLQARAGDSDASLLPALDGLKRSLQQQQRFDDAYDVSLRDLAIRESTNDRDVPLALSEVADMLNEAGRPAEALQHYRRRLALKNVDDWSDSAETSVLRNFAVALRNSGHLDEAESVCRRVLFTVEENGRGDDAAVVIQAIYHLAVCLVLEDKSAEARVQIERAWNSGHADATGMTKRLLWARLATALTARAPGALFIAQLKTALNAAAQALPVDNGVEGATDLTGIVAFLRTRRPELGAFLEALAAAINDRALIGDLERFPAWASVEPMPLESSWPSDLPSSQPESEPLPPPPWCETS
jgi:tetratricopeptide (TPR) repeat protein